MQLILSVTISSNLKQEQSHNLNMNNITSVEQFDEDILLKGDDKSSSDDPSLSDIMRFLIQMDASNKSSARATEMQLARHDKGIEKISNEMLTMQGEMVNIKSDVSSSKNEISEIKSEVTAITNTTEYYQELQIQYKLENCLTIIGIPPFQNENLSVLEDTVIRIAGTLGVALNATEIDTTYRTKRNESIVVKLSKNSKKNKILEQRRKKIIKAGECFNGLNADLANKIVYINQQLTPFFSELSRTCRQLMKRGQLHGYWMANKGIMVQKRNDSAPFLVKSSDELIKLVQNEEMLDDGMQQSQNKRRNNVISPSANNNFSKRKLNNTTHAKIQEVQVQIQQMSLPGKPNQQTKPTQDKPAPRNTRSNSTHTKNT